MTGWGGGGVVVGGLVGDGKTVGVVWVGLLDIGEVFILFGLISGRGSGRDIWLVIFSSM